MPKTAKGTRLWLRAREGKTPVWIIRDGSRQVSTGCCIGERAEAEKRLAAYIADKYKPARTKGRDPDVIPIADVLSIYQDFRADKVRRPVELCQRIEALLGFFGTRRLGEIDGKLCRDYAKHRGSQSLARRELEDLRAAINHHREEGYCNAVVSVVLPDRSLPRERWLTRSEAARLIWAAWRYREVQNYRATDRRTRQHIARFILVALYTGTRSSAVCGASFVEAIGRGHVDLDTGLFRRLAIGARQTKKRQPTIRLPDRLLAHISRWRRLGISKSAVVEFEGKPVKSVRKAFARVAKDAGLAGVTPHVLRHTAVTWAMQNRVPVYDASDYFGMTLEVLQTVYGHHHPDSGKEVGDAVTRRRR